MSRWFRMYDDVINDPKVMRLAPAMRWQALLRALDGEETELSPFVRPDSGRPSAGEWALIRSAVFARDDYTCTYCRTRGGRLQCDHIVPVSRGGSHDAENLATACEPCNRSKGCKLLSEWRQ